MISQNWYHTLVFLATQEAELEDQKFKADIQNGILKIRDWRTINPGSVRLSREEHLRWTLSFLPLLIKILKILTLMYLGTRIPFLHKE